MKMRRLSIHQAAPWLLSGAVIALGGPGCDLDQRGPADHRNVETAEDLVELPDGTAAELLQLAKNSLATSKQLAQQKSAAQRDKQRKQQWKEEFRITTLTGVQAANQVLSDPAASQEQVIEARKAKLLLLYVGAKSDRLKFEHRFDDFADELQEQHPDSEVAAFAAAAGLELQCDSSRASKKEMFPKLAKHAQRYPDHDAGVQLFEVFARQLSSRKDEAGAEECYRLGIEAYGRHPEADLLRQGLNRLEQAKIQRVARRAVLDSEERDIRRRLGYPDGCFVVYAEEQVKPPRGGFMYFYHYEYEVLHGVDSAVDYVKNLPETYIWKLERRYPETSEGRRQAYELWKTLLDKKQ